MKNTKEKQTTPIKFEAKLFEIGTWIILKLPKKASSKLPSRALAMVEGTINGLPFKEVLEPDGGGSHWFKLEKSLIDKLKVSAGDTVKLEISPTQDWIEPEIPNDLKEALTSAPLSEATWMKTTPNARWDWIRWIRATNNPETRKKRIIVALSKLKSGMRRPCCFNRNACTEPYVASSKWVLLEPTV